MLAGEADAELTVGQQYTITVGAGGSAGNPGSNGNNSVFSGAGITTITATAGGRGGAGFQMRQMAMGKTVGLVEAVVSIKTPL